MRNAMVVTTTALLFLLAACGGKDANTKICLQEYGQLQELMAKKDDGARKLAGGVYQSCEISCDVTGDDDACKAFADVTRTMCDKGGKAICEKLCEGSNGKKNEIACALIE